MTKLQITGLINSDGQPMFSGIDRWKEFFSSFPDKSFICEITILEPYSEDHITWYYIKVVLPAVRDRFLALGEIMTLPEIDKFFRSELKVLRNDESGEDKRIFDFDRWEPVHECSREELIIFIEVLNKYCAENIGLIISREI